MNECRLPAEVAHLQYASPNYLHFHYTVPLRVYFVQKYTLGWPSYMQSMENCHSISASFRGRSHTQTLCDVSHLSMGRVYQIVGNNTWQHADAVHLIFEIFDRSVGRRMGPPEYLMNVRAAMSWDVDKL